MTELDDQATTTHDGPPLITGDRTCLACGYNLIGRPVTREPHHGLLVVQCPECGGFDAVTGQPATGRWGSRIVGTLVAVWLLVLVATWMGTAGMLFGMSLGGTESLVDGVGRELNRLHGDAEAAGGPAVFADWFASADHDALRDAVGGLRFGNLWLHALFMIPVGAVGMIWSCLLLWRGRPSLIVWSFVLLASAGVFTTVAIVGRSTTPNWASDAAIALLGVRAAALSLALLWVPLFVGLLAGRPIARLVVRALLPPRLRSLLHPLWTCDGLAAPRPV